VLVLESSERSAKPCQPKRKGLLSPAIGREVWIMAREDVFLLKRGKRGGELELFFNA